MPRRVAFDAEAWLAALGLECYAPQFRANDVDARTLPLLTSEDLAAMGVASVGHRRRILSAASRGAAEPAVERRILTVMFVDLVESTALSARLDVEDYHDVIARFRRDATEVLRSHGGHLSQFLGDGVMASFGYPVSTEHAAERAVAAAMAVLEHSAQLSPDPAVLPIRLRIGIATGLAVVGGADGDGAPGGASAIGETPNLAARLQAAAEPGTVVISAPTRNLIGNLFDCDDLGERSLKGLPGAVRMWRVRGRSRAATRFEALRAPQRRAPFTGREEELDALVTELGRAEAGRAGITLVTGEAGLGKSRLVRRALALGRPAAAGEALVLQCSPYGMGFPFHPIRYVLLRACEFGPTQRPEVVQAQVAAHLDSVGLSGAAAAPLMATVLDPGGDAGDLPLGLDPPETRARLMGVLSDYLEKRARAARALVVEDAHWLDPSTAGLLEDLLPRLRAGGIPVLATARPDGPLAPWLTAPDVTKVGLERLPSAELMALVTAMAGPDQLSPGIVRAIAARSDGVPVFAEELTWAYLEGALSEEPGDDLAEVPLTLAELLLSRLDRLTLGRRLASIAAAIGREFPVAILVAVAGLPEEAVRDNIGELVAAGILEEGHSRFGEAVRFRHNLVRDAAYELLLHREHAALHRRIADVLERDFPDIAQTLPHVVAIQRGHAGQWAEARDAWRRAGHDASGRSAYAEAAGSFAKAIEANARLDPGRDRDECELSIRLQLLAALVCANGYRSPPVDAESENILALSTRMGSAVSVVPAMQVRWVQLASEGNVKGALQLALQTRVATAGASVEERLVAERLCGTSYLFTGRFAEALAHYQAFLNLYDPDLHGPVMRRGHTDHSVAVLVGMAEATVLRGDASGADHWRQRALQAARLSGRVHDLALTLTYAGCFHSFLLGRTDDVPAYAAELADLLARHAMPNWVGYRDLFDGLVAIRRGGDKAGPAAVRRGVEALLETRAFGEWWLVLAAGGCADAGDWRSAEKMLALARPRIDQGWLRVGVEYHRLMCRLHDHRGEHEAAAASFEQALDLAWAQEAGLLGARVRSELPIPA